MTIKIYKPTKTYAKLDNEFIGSFNNPSYFFSQKPSGSSKIIPFQKIKPNIK